MLSRETGSLTRTKALSGNEAVTPQLYTTTKLFSKVTELLSTLKKERPEAHVALDVAAGAGALSKFLHETLGMVVHATDIDPSKWQYSRVPLTTADASKKLPFPEASMDLVVCMEGLKHFTDVATAVKELTRVLKPGGQLLLTIPNDLCIQSRLRYAFDGFVDTDWRYPLDPNAPERSQHLYVNSLISLPYLYYHLQTNDLTVVQTVTSRLRPLSIILGSLLYPFIYWRTSKACPKKHWVRGELLSMKWLAGRHNVIVCQKKMPSRKQRINYS